MEILAIVQCVTGLMGGRFKLSRDEAGVSLVEVIFAIGVMAIVITGVAGMMMASFGARTKGYNRKKAAELGQYVMETIISHRAEDPVSFWDSASNFWSLRLGAGKTIPAYGQYSYGVSFTQVTGNGCSPTAMECATVVVDVGWSGGGNVIFTRFFTRD